MTICVAASFTADPFVAWLRWWLAEVLHQRTTVELAPFGTLLQQLHSPPRLSSLFVGLLRLDDEQQLEHIIAGVRHCLTRVQRLLIFVCPSREIADSEDARMNAELRQLAQVEPRLVVISANDVLGWYPTRFVHDSIADAIGHVPYADEFFAAMAGAAARSLLPALHAPLKLIVCDCDYTLWEHAVGEVGVGGLVFEERHRQLHRRLVELVRSRGVYLALCSRNLEHDVWSALERDECTLKREHVAAHRVAPTLRKSHALAEIAASLEVGLESVLFIDDNAAEVSDVRATWPRVPCWLFPTSSPPRQPKSPLLSAREEGYCP